MATSQKQHGGQKRDRQSLMVEILRDNGRPEAGAVYEAMDMDWAKLVGQIVDASAR